MKILSGIALFFILCSALAREGIETITVTASKEKRLASEVPLSLSVLQDDRLNQLRSSGMDVRFMTNRVPSLQASSGFGRVYPYFFIRGLGNTDFDMNASQPVSIIHDGIVLENPWLKGTPIFDVERIEVLRGPQGTLFGRNTPAGIIKVETARPTWDFEGYGRLSYGRFGSVNFEGVLSEALIPSVLAGRISVLTEHRKGWIDNIYTGEEGALGGYRDFNNRVQLLWTPSESLSGRFKYHHRNLDSSARAFHANALLPAQPGRLRPSFRRDQISHDGKNSQDLSNNGFSAELTHDSGAIKFISLTGWERLKGLSRGDVDGGFGASFNLPSGPAGEIPFPSETADGISALRQLSQEFRLEHKISKSFGWRIGAFYFNEKLKTDGFSYDTFNENIQNGLIRQKQQTRAWALFAATTFDMTDKVKTSAGLRISKDSKDYSTERLQSPIGTGPLGPLHKAPKDTVPSWDASIHYRMSPGISPYARVASSFRAPSIQGRLLFGNDVTVAETEKIISVESGVKLRLWDQRLHLDLAAYHFLMNDQQLTAGSGTNNANRLVNAERTIGRGIEAEGALALDYGFDLSFGLSYNYTRLDDPGFFIQPCGSNCTVLDPPGSASETVSIHGNSLPHAPRWMANFNLSHTHNFSSGAKLILSTDWIYRSRINFFLYESREFGDTSLLEGGIRLGWHSPTDRWEVAAFGRNILNNLSPTGGVDFNNLTAFVNEPPFWGLQALMRF